jgi:hypothetical protein
MLWLLEAAGEGVNSSFFWSKFLPAALNVLCAGGLVDGLVWCVGGREELLSEFRIRKYSHSKNQRVWIQDFSDLANPGPSVT